MRKIDVVSCILGITTGLVGLAILGIYLDYRGRRMERDELKWSP